LWRRSFHYQRYQTLQISAVKTPSFGEEYCRQFSSIGRRFYSVAYHRTLSAHCYVKVDIECILASEGGIHRAVHLRQLYKPPSRCTEAASAFHCHAPAKSIMNNTTIVDTHLLPPLYRILISILHPANQPRTNPNYQLMKEPVLLSVNVIPVNSFHNNQAPCDRMP